MGTFLQLFATFEAKREKIDPKNKQKYFFQI
jgi:hypothetical protein